MNFMKISDLSKMYGVSPTTMRTILGRSAFSEFDFGKHLFSNGRVATAYNCNEKFHELMKKAIFKVKYKG